jgi:hypothetical protein
MRQLTEREWTSLFDRCRTAAWHLALRDVYSAEDEGEHFARFLATGMRDEDTEAADRRIWLSLMRSTTGRGVQVRRARIVSEPVTDYVRFEHAGTSLNVAAGEEVRWLPRAGASGIALPGNDFWLFDFETAMFSHFSGDGRSLGQDLTTDPWAVRLCRSAFEAVWSQAIPQALYAPAPAGNPAVR